MCLKSAVLSKFSNKFHRVHNLRSDGIQEVSGSIPLISTKTKSHSERNGFCFILGQKGAKNAVVRRFVFLRRASAAFLRLRTENRKNTNCTEAAPQPEHPAYLHQAKDILPDVSACRKSLAEFRARRRERHVDYFSRRRVRREKYTPACKCAGCPLLADRSCAQQAAACCRKTPKEFFDSLNPAAGRSCRRIVIRV